MPITPPLPTPRRNVPLKADHGITATLPSSNTKSHSDLTSNRQQLPPVLRSRLNTSTMIQLPVAQVFPVKRKSDAMCFPPPPSKTLCLDNDDKLCPRPQRPASIVTNPRFRRRSQDLLTNSSKSFVEVEASTQSSTPSPCSPSLLLTETRDTQTSPATSNLSDGNKSSNNKLISNICRSARKRIAHLRRTFSSDRIRDSSSNTSISTPKRRRRSSIHRFITKFSSNNSPAVHGTIIRLHPDGSRTIRLSRPKGKAPFGFYVVRQKNALFLSRFTDEEASKRYRGLISVGDEVLEIDGLCTSELDLSEIHRAISEWQTVTMRVMSSYERRL